MDFLEEHVLQAWDMAKKKKPTKGKPVVFGQWSSDRAKLSYPDIDTAGIHLWQAIDPEFADRTETCRQLDPERRLLLAVLEDAVYTLKYQSSSAKPWRTRQQVDLARIWLESNECFDCFCFVSICWTLGFDHEYLRRGIKKYIAIPPKKVRRATANVSHRGPIGGRHKRAFA